MIYSTLLASRNSKMGRRCAQFLVMMTLALSSPLSNLSQEATAAPLAWVHTNLADFSNGTLWNVDIVSDPGNVSLASSLTTWIESRFNPGLRRGPSGTWDDSGVAHPVVLKEDGLYKMWYAGYNSAEGKTRIGYAISQDGVNWTKPRVGLTSYGGNTNNNIVLDTWTGNLSEDTSLLPGSVIRDQGGYRMWYSCKGQGWGICHASSMDGLDWVRSIFNPVIVPTNNSGFLSPAVFQDSVGFQMMFSRLDTNGIHNLMRAESVDGLSWTQVVTLANEGLGEAGGWFDKGILPGAIMKSEGLLHMWHSGMHGQVQSIGLSSSSDGVEWTHSHLNPIIVTDHVAAWGSASLSSPSVIEDGSVHRMWFAGFDGNWWSIGTATSAHGERVRPPRTNPVLPVGDITSWDSGGVFRPSVLFKDGLYHMWYTGSTSLDGSSGLAIGHATSTDGVEWKKSSSGPVFEKNLTGWDSEWVGFSWVTWDEASGLYHMWYTGSDGTANHVGLSTSPDGESWQRSPHNPITFSHWQPWFNDSDVRCPWMTPSNNGHDMLIGTQVDGRVSIARARSTDGGDSWNVSDTLPVLSPVSGTWEGSSVGCPTVVKDSTGQFVSIWYEGSTDASILSFGGIGFAESNDYGSSFTRSQPSKSLSGSRPWNKEGIGGPSVLMADDHLRLWFHGKDLDRARIGTAVSRTGATWHDMFVAPTQFGGAGASSPVIIEHAPWPSWVMYNAEMQGGKWEIVYSVSPDGVTWGETFNINMSGGSQGSWDIGGRRPLAVLKDSDHYRMWYAGMDAQGRWSIGHATSTLIGDWQADPNNPVLVRGQQGAWDSEGVISASVVYPGLTYPYEMWYTGFDGSTWRIGFAHSSDGSAWMKTAANPVMFPSPSSWDSVATSSPRILLENGLYHGFYSGFDGEAWSLCHAFSLNGINWLKSRYNPILGGGWSSSHVNGDIKESWVLRTETGYRLWVSDASHYGAAIAYVDASHLSVGSLISSALESRTIAPTWTSVSVTGTKSPLSRMSLSLRSGSPPFSGIVWSTETTASVIQPAVGRGVSLQYRLTLVSMTGETTAILEEISGEYMPDQEPGIIAIDPKGGKCIGTDRPTFTWEYSDPEGDLQGGYMFQVARDHNFSSGLHSISASDPWQGVRIDKSLSDGSWFWRVLAWDEHNLPSPWSETSWFCIDTAPPRTSLNITGPQSGIYPRYISFHSLLYFERSDSGCGGGVTMVRINKGTWQEFIPPLNLSSPGRFLVEFYSLDAAGNQEPVKAVDLWVDSSPPITEILTGTPSLEFGNVLHITPTTPLLLSAEDSESGVESTLYAIDDVLDMEPAIGPLLLTSLTGQHTLYYRSTDKVGNNEVTREREVFVDGSPPTTSLKFKGGHILGNPVFITPSTRIELDSFDDGAGVESTYYSFDGGPAFQYTSNFTFAAEGLHSFSYYSRDRLQNLETKHIIQLYIDGNGPYTSIVPLGPNYVTSTEMYVRSDTPLTLASSDGGAGTERVYYSIDGGPWTSYSSPFNISSTGVHNLSFFATDTLGNNESMKILKIIVDDDPPTSEVNFFGTVIEHDGTTYVDGESSIEILADDGGSGVFIVRFRVDNGEWYPYTAPFQVTESGQHLIETQVTDNLGNSGTSQSVWIVVDAGPPVADAGADVAKFAPADILLDASHSSDDTIIVRYEWVTNHDGKIILTNTSGLIHFDEPGTFVLTLRVWDPLGRDSKDTVTIRVLRDPDFDRDLLPDVWELERFGNLSFGPDDDPDGDGWTVRQDYDKGAGIGALGNDDRTDNQGNRDQDAIILILVALSGILVGVLILTLIKNRELQRRLNHREAEDSIEVEDDLD